MWIVVKQATKVAGLINYDFDKQEEGKSKLQYSNLSVASDRYQTIDMFDHFKDSAYRTVSKPFLVGSVNLHPSEHLNPEDLENVAKAYLEKLGLEDSPVFMTYHDDRAHKHLHFIVSRTDYFGKTTNLAGHFYLREAKEISNYFNESYGFKIVSKDNEKEPNVSHTEASLSNYSILRYANATQSTDPILLEIKQHSMSNTMIAEQFPVAVVKDLTRKAKPESYLSVLKSRLEKVYQKAHSFENFEEQVAQSGLYIRAISDDKDVDKKVMSYGVEFNGSMKYVHEAKLPYKFSFASIHQINDIKAGKVKAYTYNQQKVMLKRILNNTKEQSRDLQSFFKDLSSKGVDVEFHYSGERLNGYRIRLENTTESFDFKASSVDRNLSLSNLSAYFNNQGAIIETVAPVVELGETPEPIQLSGNKYRAIGDEEEDPEERSKRKRKGKQRW